MSEAFEEFLKGAIIDGKLASNEFEELKAQENYLSKTGYYAD